MSIREKMITAVISGLKELPADKDEYAVIENLYFFNASYSIFRFVSWFLFRAPRINSAKLKEINDLLPEYDDLMHKKLIEMEKKPFPGLIRPQVESIIRLLKTVDNSTPVLVSLGSGGMEVERQILSELNSNDLHQKKLLIFAIDISQTAHAIAKINLKEFEHDLVFHESDKIDLEFIANFKKDPTKHHVVFVKGDIFTVIGTYTGQLFDIAYHTLFKHHLDSDQKIKLDILLTSKARRISEYDGYRSWFNMIPQVIVGWNNPIFLNAEIFSNLRFNQKKLIKEKVVSRKIKFFRIGYYVLQYDS